MAQTAEENRSPQKRPASRSVSPGVFLLVMVLAVAMGAVAYWFEDLQGWFSTQAWDTGAPKQTVASLIRVAHAEDNARLAELLAPNVFQLKKNERGQVTSVDYVKYSGRTSQAPKDLVPAGEPRVMEVVFRKSGERNFFSVITQFANGKWGVFRVDRINGKPMISELPPVLVDKRPENLRLY